VSGDSNDNEIPDLRACVRDLAALSALPSLWAARDAAEVLASFVDIVGSSLRLDLLYARIEDPRSGAPVEAIHAGDRAQELPQSMVAKIARMLAPLEPAAHPPTIESPLDGGAPLRVAILPAPTGEGAVYACSRRPGFPTSIESAVLGAASNQIAMWLRLTHLLADTRRVEAKLAERESTQIRLEAENAYLREEVDVALAFGGIVGQSPRLRDILTELELVAPTEATVLILGESGTGKELLAREIHERSRRAGRPLIKVNCSAIPREMFESEFFGHVRGAFTGAVRDRPGRFKLAEKGTIFLDEVGDLPLDLQPKLLRVLQEGQYERVGDDTTRSIDVRVIAATNRDLGREVSAGRFREDLYYRLSVFPLAIPPLRERKEDILPLATHFISLVSKGIGISPVPHLTEPQQAALCAYDWPGNVRELQNVIERAVILGRGGELRLDQVLGARAERRKTTSAPRPLRAPEIISDQEWRRLERENLIAALTRTAGRIYGVGGAAELLGVKPSTLQSRLRALGIRPRDNV
jgi:transcriptional regulator with GAF, ATPase, and Fis domain